MSQNQEQEIKQTQELADALAGVEGKESVLLTPEQTLGLLLRQHGDFVSEYQTSKLNARIASICQDYQRSKQFLLQASHVLKRIVALRHVANEEGLGEAYSQAMEQFKASQSASGNTVTGDAAEPSSEDKKAATKAGTTQAKSARKKPTRRKSK